MLTKRVIACLDVKDGKVVKGVQFKELQVVGEIQALAAHYSEAGIDELVFYDITASAEGRSVDLSWVSAVAREISIPFCVAGGIRSVSDAQSVLAAGADKVSINSPALENPALIQALSREFGRQCVVVGVDSCWVNNDYRVFQYAGLDSTRAEAGLRTQEWLQQCEALGAGEIVLNCMQSDGMRGGYDCQQLALMRQVIDIPLVASGGAGSIDHIIACFDESGADAALAASVFHSGEVSIMALKEKLKQHGHEVRL